MRQVLRGQATRYEGNRQIHTENPAGAGASKRGQQQRVVERAKDPRKTLFQDRLRDKITREFACRESFLLPSQRL